MTFLCISARCSQIKHCTVALVPGSSLVCKWVFCGFLHSSPKCWCGGLHLKESLESRLPFSLVCNMLPSLKIHYIIYALYAIPLASLGPKHTLLNIFFYTHSISLIWNSYIIYPSWITRSGNQQTLLWFTDLSHVNTRLHLSGFSVSL